MLKLVKTKSTRIRIALSFYQTVYKKLISKNTLSPVSSDTIL